MLLLEPEGLADAALDTVAHDRRPRVAPRHQDAEARAAAIAVGEVERVAIRASPRPFAQQAFEFRLAPQAARRVQAETLAARGYNPRRRRPFARRLRSTARPPRVLLRTRKPWRRARRVLDGW